MRGTRVLVLTGVLSVALLAVVTPGSLLTTRVAPGLWFRILGPKVLVPGSAASIEWNASPRNVARYPAERVDICFGTPVKRTCTALSARTPNDGHEVVQIPASLPEGPAILRLTAVRSERVLSYVRATLRVVVRKGVPPSPPPPPSRGGSCGALSVTAQPDEISPTTCEFRVMMPGLDCEDENGKPIDCPYGYTLDIGERIVGPITRIGGLRLLLTNESTARFPQGTYRLGSGASDIAGSTIAVGGRLRLLQAGEITINREGNVVAVSFDLTFDQRIHITGSGRVPIVVVPGGPP